MKWLQRLFENPAYADLARAKKHQSDRAAKAEQERDQVRAELRTVTIDRDSAKDRIIWLESELDPPVCRLQFPDGSVPGNAREAAEGWKKWFDENRDGLHKELEAVKARETEVYAATVQAHDERDALRKELVKSHSSRDGLRHLLQQSWELLREIERQVAEPDSPRESNAIHDETRERIQLGGRRTDGKIVEVANEPA